METLEMSQEGLAAFVIFTLEQAASSLDELLILFIVFARRFSFFTTWHFLIRLKNLALSL